jgi:hypothetical protein
MPLLQLLEVLVVVGILLWLVNRFVPMQGSIKSILNGVILPAGSRIWKLEFSRLGEPPVFPFNFDERQLALRAGERNQR